MDSRMFWTFDNLMEWGPAMTELSSLQVHIGYYAYNHLGADMQTLNYPASRYDDLEWNSFGGDMRA
jgi:hypothetical protein